jgi:hypothetical protein
MEVIPYFRPKDLFGREPPSRANDAAHPDKAGIRVSFGFRRRILLSSLFAVTLLVSPGSLWSQTGGKTGGQTRGVIDAKAPTPVSVQKPGHYYALIIGINDYQFLPHLLTPRNDAQEVASVLSDQYGFKTQLLLDANATQDQIVRALEGYQKTLSDADNLLIYYAGHGTYDRQMDEAYWAPVDAAKGTYGHWIIATVITGTAKVVPARHVLVISDSCYSGMIARDSRAADISDRTNYFEKMLQTKSRDVMASGGDEPVADSDVPGHFSHHSVFANVLLQDLTHIEVDEFTAEQLFVQVKEQVGGRSKQIPHYDAIRDSNHEGGDFVFVRLRRGPLKEKEDDADVHSAEIEPPPTRLNPDDEAVRAALDKYEEAYGSMDVRELKKAWPSLSKGQEREIRSGFEAPGLKAVKVQLRNRTTQINGGTATAKCDQWMVYTFQGRRQAPQVNTVDVLLSKDSQGEWSVNEIKGN